MVAAILFSAALLGADALPKTIAQDKKQVARVETYAEAIRAKVLPKGKLVKAPLKLDHDSVSYLIWLPPGVPPAKSRQEARLLAKQQELQWFKPQSKDKLDHAEEFGKWAGNFMQRRLMFVSYFDEDAHAKEFADVWLSPSRVSRNTTGLKVRRIDGSTVLWGHYDLVDNW